MIFIKIGLQQRIWYNLQESACSWRPCTAARRRCAGTPPPPMSSFRSRTPYQLQKQRATIWIYQVPHCLRLHYIIDNEQQIRIVYVQTSQVLFIKMTIQLLKQYTPEYAHKAVNNLQQQAVSNSKHQLALASNSKQQLHSLYMSASRQVAAERSGPATGRQAGMQQWNDLERTGDRQEIGRAHV